MIDWSKYFDKIYCIHYEKHSERAERIQNELLRVGILNSKVFKWEIGYDSPFYSYIQRGIKFHPGEDISKPQFYGAFKCSLSHYMIMKEAKYLEYNRILILEDDVVFLKDLTQIENLLDDIPDYDICLLDKFTYNNKNYGIICNDLSMKINDKYSKFDSRIDFGSSACYSLSLKAVNVFIKKLETEFCASDHTFNNYDGELKNLKRVFSYTNLAKQKNYTEHNYKNFFNEDVAYRFVNLNNSLYE